ncbi:MAG TPA: hypothetical protein VKZ53_27230 [Candidatus Angelobacter sp.]|nr:hypothetical protein [Candidatus Angelobacter sp.]
MNEPLMPEKEFYSETEAAGFLNISITRLYSLLDEHVFNDGSTRPAELTFRESDLILLGFWNQSRGNDKVVRMPRRN